MHEVLLAKKSQEVDNPIAQKKSHHRPTSQFTDNRPEAVAQRKLQEMANNSQQVKKAAQLQAMANNHSSQQPLIQKKENNTGLPDNSKTGIENLSGYSMDDVKVHYDSDKPTQLKARAYAQGADIHLAPGQEKHLPHEAWHVVQQKQGRVKPTKQMKGKVNINDDTGLEKEADLMGEKALQVKLKGNKSRAIANAVTQRQKSNESTFQFVDNRSEVIQMRKLQEMANNSTKKNSLQFVDNRTESIQMRRLQVSINNSAIRKPSNINGIIQRTINVSKNGIGVISISGRPHFLSFVKSILVQKYNTIHATNHDPNSISLTDEELDQCHKISWFDIRTFIKDYVNGNINDQSLRNNVRILYNNETNSDEATATYNLVETMIHEKNNGNLHLDKVSSVCTRLNSATPNLRLDEKSINRKIKQHFDPHLQTTPGGTHVRATPHSKLLADSDMVDTYMKKSPFHTRGHSSSIGVFNMQDLTPDTKKRKAIK